MARRADRLLRPPRPWNGRHHPVVASFTPWEGEADGRFAYDSFGVKTDPAFRPQIRPQPAGPLQSRHPAPYAPYFELIFVLQSVLDAAEQERFTMLELGAGYGPWMVTAAQAMRASANRPLRLIGVEMVPQHYEWMHAHFRNNGLDPARHKLIRAAMSDRAGAGAFLPEEDREWDYGQRLVDRGASGRPAGDPYRVDCILLSELLGELDRVDLLHVDIQGEELRVLREARGELSRRVRRLIVATHSRRIHRELRSLMDPGEWEPVYDFGYRSRCRTEFGDVQFLDGLQCFLNRRLPGAGANPAAGTESRRPERRTLP